MSTRRATNSLYEMEIALPANPGPGARAACPPWLVDRIFRNLLVDVTGNTHRAEICIDKLYSPDGATGAARSGRVPHFEMPPHARMSLAQQLLLRALDRVVLGEALSAQAGPLGHRVCTTASCCRISSGHDFRERARRFEARRLPGASWNGSRRISNSASRVYGSVDYDGVELELRQALEPWHVLGEEGAPGGTARYVDSFAGAGAGEASRAHTATATLVTCNGRPMPLDRDGPRRARPWPACASGRGSRHPRCIPPFPLHTPLVFDVVDTWTGRSIGGCRYHVAHPGGRAFETFPVNAFEAESRRLTRFETIGHSIGALRPGKPRINADFPHTLDLRLALTF